MTSEIENKFISEYDGYYTLPKKFGSVSSEYLLKVAEYNTYQASRFNNGASINFHAVAGSALIEATLIAKQDDGTLEARLERLYEAGRHLEIAAEGELALLEKGYAPFSYQDNLQRAEMNHDFMDVYRDIACGEITPFTKHEIIGKLEKRVSYNRALAKQGNKNVNNGVANEALVLLNFWRQYHREGDLVAFPSSLRGGHGVFHPGDTHDIGIALQNGKEWTFDGAEIKGHVTTDALVRYRHSIIGVDYDGNMRFFDKMAA